jgi:hypothetical protein
VRIILIAFFSITLFYNALGQDFSVVCTSVISCPSYYDPLGQFKRKCGAKKNNTKTQFYLSRDKVVMVAYNATDLFNQPVSKIKYTHDVEYSFDKIHYEHVYRFKDSTGEYRYNDETKLITRYNSLTEFVSYFPDCVAF